MDVVIADALLGDLELSWLQQSTGLRPILLSSTKAWPKSATIYSQRSTFNASIVEALSAAAPQVAIACSSREDARKWGEYATEKGLAVLRIDSTTSSKETVLRFMEQPDSYLLDNSINLLVFTNSLTSGVSIKEWVADNFFGEATGFTDAEALCQQHARVRRVGHIHVIASGVNTSEVSRITHNDDAVKELKELSGEAYRRIIDSLPPEMNRYRQGWRNRFVSENCPSNLVGTVIRFLEAQGCTVYQRHATEKRAIPRRRQLQTLEAPALDLRSALLHGLIYNELGAEDVDKILQARTATATGYELLTPMPEYTCSAEAVPRPDLLLQGVIGRVIYKDDEFLAGQARIFDELYEDMGVIGRKKLNQHFRISKPLIKSGGLTLLSARKLLELAGLPVRTTRIGQDKVQALKVDVDKISGWQALTRGLLTESTCQRKTRGN